MDLILDHPGALCSHPPSDAIPILRASSNSRTNQGFQGFSAILLENWKHKFPYTLGASVRLSCTVLGLVPMTFVSCQAHHRGSLRFQLFLPVYRRTDRYLTPNECVMVPASLAPEQDTLVCCAIQMFTKEIHLLHFTLSLKIRALDKTKPRWVSCPPD